MSRLLARLILLPTGLIHLAICLLVLWLDKKSLSSYLDGLVKARHELDEIPPLLVIDSRVCRKGATLLTPSGEQLARVEVESNGMLHWVGQSVKVSTSGKNLILRQSDLNEPMLITEEQHADM